MSEPRSVVITGASRGLGLASATHLYRNGWRVVAAMRAPEVGMTRLREATGATDDDPRLIGVQLDLTDSASVTAAAKMIAEAVGAPYALVHNAGISAAGMAEETPIGLWEKMFQTTIFGPGDADQCTAAGHARRRSGANRHGVERWRRARYAGDRAILRG